MKCIFKLLCAVVFVAAASQTQAKDPEECKPGLRHSVAESRAECAGSKKQQVSKPVPQSDATKKTNATIHVPPELPPEAPSPGVDEYLCEVYQRLPTKIDSMGDFTWKDPAAANRLGLALCDYTIGGMDPDLREALAAMGKQADNAGINWSFLSAYRDEYRQRIAVGFKASPCGSWHGARSCGNKGFGRGRAADLWVADQHGNNANPNPLFQLIDQIGGALGLNRPMKGRDPAHIETSWDFRKKAAAIRHNNAKVADDKSAGQRGRGNAWASGQGKGSRNN